MTDPTKPKLPKLAEAMRSLEQTPNSRNSMRIGETISILARDLAAPYDALIASQAEEIERLRAENAELRKLIGAMLP